MSNEEITYEQVLEYCKKRNLGLIDNEFLIRLYNHRDAIPVEWIKHWCLKHYPTYPRIITKELLKKTETWRMIEDWEEENEVD